MKTAKTALISVFDKNGIVEFAQGLTLLGWRILASGGTAKRLSEAGIDVTDVATIVGEPILGHRVVTLSREVHAALLAKDTPEDNAELARLGIPRIDLVCIDLYPLQTAIEERRPYEEVIEMIDIGGPTLLRSAAKGGRIVVSRAQDRQTVLDMLLDTGVDPGCRMYLAGLAEETVSRYCSLSSQYLLKRSDENELHKHF